ncbi:type IV secretion system protein VirB4 (plasmid) [Acinetobacter lwoffii]|uniref:VirB4 family type IV secretion/conjugal transfer ATPase n=1 Tax=Acinetobacter lwoffii TaxID=28090 RepID=UPI001C5BE060|nr:type IV secretion system protein VirB4 [Acinetobacter lwoffii]QXX88336.1 type IV secretion system protein VirB4 [Acinetobacter lwoffii]HEN9525113.1 type IV secretion system protein VirB4 [Acinetobacter baumannii]HEN9568256.1 type IV secretion system protein VirB4 [Acinetobacter baumannii]
MSKATEKQEQKDLLFAGLARVARVANIPVDIFAIFFIVGGFLITILALLGKVMTGFFIIAGIYLVLNALTYEEDRGIQYLLFSLKRKFSRKMVFGGYSFETHTKTKDEGIEYDQKQLASGELMEVSNLPYLTPIDSHNIKLVNGDIFTILKITGFAYETKSYEQLKMLKRYRAEMFKQLGSRFVVSVYYDRHEVETEIPEPHGNEFSDHFQQKYYEKLSQEHMFQNDIYISLLVRKANPSEPPFTRLKNTFFRVDNEAQMLAELSNAVSMFKEYLQDANPRQLGVYHKDNVMYSEAVNFLGYMVNLERAEIPLYPTEIRNYLGFVRKVFTPDGTIKFYHPSGEVTAGAIYSLPTPNYPEHTDHTMLDEFLKVDHPLLISQTFMMMDRRKSINMSIQRQNQLKNAKDKSESQIEAINQAVDDLASGRILNGIYSLNVLVTAKNGAAFKDAMQKTSGAFQRNHMLPKKEDLIAEPTFYSTLIGNYHLLQRPATINTTNFAGFASMHNSSIGKKEGNHWGEYVLQLKTEGNTPYYFNFHEGDVGHTRITTGTGGGKTTLINALLTAADKFKPYIFHFDFEYSASVWIQAMGGKHTVLSEMVPTGWNPLQLDDTDQNRLFLNKLFAFMGQDYNEAGNPKPLSAAEENKIKEVVEAVYSYEKTLRRLRNFISLFGMAENNNLAERMAKWANNGHFANIFDNEGDNFSIEDARIFGYEMKNVIKNDVVLGAMSMYIFHRIDIAMSEGRPFIVVVEEGQRYISNPINLAWLKIMLTTYRRRNGMMIFVTPTPEVITKDDDLIGQFKTSILLPNDKANPATYMGNDQNSGLGCTQTEFEWIVNTPPYLRQFMIKNSHDSVISKLDLGNMSEIIPVFSGNEVRHKMLEETLSKNENLTYSQWVNEFNEKVKS